MWFSVDRSISMHYKALLFICVSSLFVMETLSKCKVPTKTIDLEKYKLEDFNGTWYTQAIYDPLDDPDFKPFCVTDEFKRGDDMSLHGHSFIRNTCESEYSKEYEFIIKHNDETGHLTMELLLFEDGPAYQELPHYFISGEPGKFLVMYSCKDYIADLHVEALSYLTITSESKPGLLFRMHQDAKEAGLSHAAKKMVFAAPGFCGAA